ncbi:MAG: hypothetical protein Q8P61_00170 [Candidatus Nanopelagicales bacterium]|nr:hypothetical protein [Candidatus Nanopelagicales bacterium]
MAYVDINLADVATGVDQDAIKMPAGNYVIVSGQVYTSEAWNSTSSDVISVGDDDAYNTYLNAASIAGTGIDDLVPTGVVGDGDITVRWVSGGGTPTTGISRLAIQYYMLGRADSTFG